VVRVERHRQCAIEILLIGRSGETHFNAAMRDSTCGPFGNRTRRTRACGCRAGGGRDFSSGGDLDEFGRVSDPQPARPSPCPHVGRMGGEIAIV